MPIKEGWTRKTRSAEEMLCFTLLVAQTHTDTHIQTSRAKNLTRLDSFDASQESISISTRPSHSAPD